MIKSEVGNTDENVPVNISENTAENNVDNIAEEITIKKGKHIAGTEEIHAVAEEINAIADRLDKEIKAFKI